MNLDTPADWVGRTVRLMGSKEDAAFGPAVVLAVDNVPYAPAAWIKFQSPAGNPAYRSCDLSDLMDVESGDYGPRYTAAFDILATPVLGVAEAGVWRESPYDFDPLSGPFQPARAR